MEGIGGLKSRKQTPTSTNIVFDNSLPRRLLTKKRKRIYKIVRQKSNGNKLSSIVFFIFLLLLLLKIIHSCDNDLDWLYDELNISTVNVFDTQEAELFIDKNKKKPGLDHLLKKYHLCNMDKAYKKQFQQSNWKDRPLTEDQIIYAAQDSYYLIKLREILGKKMGNNINVFTTKMNEKIKNKYGKSHAERCEIKATNFFNSNYVKFNPHMYEISKAVMISLVKHFDEIARKLDKNVEKIMKLKLLYRISTQFPEDSFVLEELFKQENVTYDEPSMFKVKQIIEVVKSEKFDLLNEKV